MWSLCVSAGKMLKMSNNTISSGTTLLNMQSCMLGMRERRGKWVAQLQYVCSVFVISIECTSSTQWTPGLRPLVDSLSRRIHFQVCTWFMLHINSECSRVNWIPHRLLAEKACGLFIKLCSEVPANHSHAFGWAVVCWMHCLYNKVCVSILSHSSESSSCLSSGWSLSENDIFIALWVVS